MHVGWGNDRTQHRHARTICIALPQAFRRALWTRYRTWEDIKGSFWGDSTRPSRTLLEERFPSLQKGSNCMVWIWETDALGEQCTRLETWAHLSVSLCLSVLTKQDRSTGWRHALQNSSVRLAPSLSHLTNEKTGPQRGLSDLPSIRHLASSGARIQAPEEVWIQSLSSTPSLYCASPERSDSLSIYSLHNLMDGQIN